LVYMFLHIFKLKLTSYQKKMEGCRQKIRELNALVPDEEAFKSPDFNLTIDEMRLLKLLAQGMSKNEIADTLLYSVAALGVIIMFIYRKMGVSGRKEAIGLAISLGLVKQEDKTE
jgi:DNA-binding CsgD family transcriptional regulator